MLSSKISSRLGLPILVLFLLLGMLAGSEGPGGLPFENYDLAHRIGIFALALILFDGGLRTPRAALARAWAPGVALATLGVLITAILTGAFAARLLDLPPLVALLLGAIVGSTDAAAVFAVLRSRDLSLPERVAATLEVESGSNDPMAVFLTVAALEMVTGRLEPGWPLAALFVAQMGVGAVVGLVAGRAGVELVNRVHLEAAGLYPLLAVATGLLAYGLAAAAGGSGFLAVYLAGIVLGNHRIVFRRGIFMFHDGIAWLAQLVMFVVLGLLSFPSRLAAVAGPGLMVALVLMLIARPAAVFAILAPFRFGVREMAFISWCGLKGAVPIVLAIFPLLYGLPGADVLFDVVFFVVLVSAVTQGWPLQPLARALKLLEPVPSQPPLTLEITSLRHVDADIVEYEITEDSRVCGRAIRELALPDGVVVALIARGHEVMAPRGSTRLQAGDYVFVSLRAEVRPFVDRLFSGASPEDIPALVEFPLRGRTTLADLETFYGVRIEGPPDMMLDGLLRERLGEGLVPGAAMVVGGIVLVAREIVAGRVETVGLALPDEELRRD